MATLPNWVRRNPDRYLERLGFEAEMLSDAFPAFTLMTEGDVLYAEGDFVTLSKNRYRVRVFYPENYPYDPPSAIITDRDVVEYCKNQSAHDFHHLGVSPEMGGLRLCTMRRDDSHGQGWLPDFSVVTILNLAAAWLHAYEVRRVTGQWILPE